MCIFKAFIHFIHSSICRRNFETVAEQAPEAASIPGETPFADFVQTEISWMFQRVMSASVDLAGHVLEKVL
jgi:hypothetical protein